MSVYWKEIKRWIARGKDFTVEVMHENLGATQSKADANRWGVCAYIYSSHPHFAKFSGDELGQEAAVAMPLHWGPSSIRWHHYGSGFHTTSVQVGCDYCHLPDDAYERMSTREEASGVFHDAERLFQWLENYPQSDRERKTGPVA